MSVDRNIFIHHSATPADLDIGAADIREWHLDRGWKDIGYHLVIRRDGMLEQGRPWDQVGAHTLGNNEAFGICVVGTGPDFTVEQWTRLSFVVAFLRAYYPRAEVLGHRERGATKCPGFDVKHWLKTREVRS